MGKLDTEFCWKQLNLSKFLPAFAAPPHFQWCTTALLLSKFWSPMFSRFKWIFYSISTWPRNKNFSDGHSLTNTIVNSSNNESKLKVFYDTEPDTRAVFGVLLALAATIFYFISSNDRDLKPSSSGCSQQLGMGAVGNGAPKYHLLAQSWTRPNERNTPRRKDRAAAPVF